MDHLKVNLAHKQADGYVIPLGPVNLVSVLTDVGMVGCGAFDVGALNNFGYPAARVRSTTDSPIATIDDLLQGIVKEVNPAAKKLGLKNGMTGREALDLLYGIGEYRISIFFNASEIQCIQPVILSAAHPSALI